MAIAWVQQTAFVNPNIQFSSAQTGGNTNFLIILVQGSTSTPTNVGDSIGNTYSLVSNTGGTTVMVWLYSSFGISVAGAGANKLNVPSVSGATQIWYSAGEYSGVANSIDGSVQFGTGTSATGSTSTLTTTNATDLLLVAAVQNTTSGTVTAGSGYTLRYFQGGPQAPNGGIEDQITSTTGSFTGTINFPSSAVWAALQVAYKAAGSGSVNPTLAGNLLVTGVQAAAPGVPVAPISGSLLMTGRAIVTGLTPPPSGGSVTGAPNLWWWAYNDSRDR